MTEDAHGRDYDVIVLGGGADLLRTQIAQRTVQPSD